MASLAKRLTLDTNVAIFILDVSRALSYYCLVTVL